jgi:hypothetical protein
LAEQSGPGTAGAAGSAEAVPGCELCAARPLTPWFHADDRCWVAECLICRTPMVVWRHHGADPPPEDRDHMLARLSEVAAERLGGEFRIDGVMRRIPDHFHAHARDPAWPGFAWGRPGG